MAEKSRFKVRSIKNPHAQSCLMIWGNWCRESKDALGYKSPALRGIQKNIGDTRRILELNPDIAERMEILLLKIKDSSPIIFQMLRFCYVNRMSLAAIGKELHKSASTIHKYLDLVEEEIEQKLEEMNLTT